MELRHLRYFTAVAEEQNVTRAAARLHVSQPPLSRQIRDLEEELGVALFKRTAKSLELTEAGKIFLNEARAVLLRADDAVQAVRAVAKGARGYVRVGYAPSLTVEILPNALKLFEQNHPGARVELHDCSTEEAARKLLERKLDIGLGVKPVGRVGRGLVFDKLATYPLCCAVGASHPFAKKRSVNAAQIKGERLIGYSQDEYPEYHAWLREIFQPFGFDPMIVEEHDSVTSVIAAVEAGHGIAIAPVSLRCLAGPRLKLLPFQPALPPLVMGVLYRTPLSPAGEFFVDAVRKSVALNRIGSQRVDIPPRGL
jgi:LysR family transcriptional regulator, benzoate and cis,cis-muconate-responsive activator of ben and cat genes